MLQAIGPPWSTLQYLKAHQNRLRVFFSSGLLEEISFTQDICQNNWFVTNDHSLHQSNAYAVIKGLLIKAEELGLKKSFMNPSSTVAKLDNTK